MQPRPCHPERAKRVELRSSARCNRAGSRAKRRLNVLRLHTHKQNRYGKVKDGQTVAILSFNERGEMQSRGFRTEELEQLLKEISKDNK